MSCITTNYIIFHRFWLRTQMYCHSLGINSLCIDQVNSEVNSLWYDSRGSVWMPRLHQDFRILSWSTCKLTPIPKGLLHSLSNPLSSFFFNALITQESLPPSEIINNHTILYIIIFCLYKQYFFALSIIILFTTVCFNFFKVFYFFNFILIYFQNSTYWSYRFPFFALTSISSYETW